MRRTWLWIIVFMAIALAVNGNPARTTEIHNTSISSFGYDAGTLGVHNAFFGLSAGYSNLSNGQYNSFFG